MPQNDDQFDLPPLAPPVDLPPGWGAPPVTTPSSADFVDAGRSYHDAVPYVSPQFSLQSMFIGVTALAVYFGLLRAIHIFGLVLLLVAYVVGIRRWPRDERSPAMHLGFDLVGGALLPLSAVLFAASGLARSALLSTAAISLLMSAALVVAWMFAGRWFNCTMFAFTSGMLTVGAWFSFFLGGWICLLAFVGMITMLLFSPRIDAVVMLLSAIPLLAGRVYFRHAEDTWDYAGESHGTSLAWGAGVACTVATLMASLLLADPLNAVWRQLAAIF